MPVIDCKDRDQYDSAIEFLVNRGIGFHTRPPQQIVVRSEDYRALQEAKIISTEAVKANGSRGKKTRSSAKS